MTLAALLAAFARILPIGLVILLGHGLRRWRLLAEATVQELKALIVRVTLPALLFTAFARVEARARYLGLVAALFAACLLARLVGGGLRRLLRVPHRTFPLLLTGFEAGMMGYALFTAVYGADALYRFALLDLGQALFVYFVVIPGLARGGEGAGSAWQAVRGFATNPVILAIAAGLLAQATGLSGVLQSAALGQALLEALRLVASLTGPLVALAIGYELHLDWSRLGRPVLTVLVRLALWIPLALFLGRVVMGRWLGLEPEFQTALLVLVVLPPPFVIPIFMREEDRRDLSYTLDALAVATLVALAAVSAVVVMHPR